MLSDSNKKSLEKLKTAASVTTVVVAATVSAPAALATAATFAAVGIVGYLASSISGDKEGEEYFGEVAKSGTKDFLSVGIGGELSNLNVAEKVAAGVALYADGQRIKQTGEFLKNELITECGDFISEVGTSEVTGAFIDYGSSEVSKKICDKDVFETTKGKLYRDLAKIAMDEVPNIYQVAESYVEDCDYGYKRNSSGKNRDPIPFRLMPMPDYMINPTKVVEPTCGFTRTMTMLDKNNKPKYTYSTRKSGRNSYNHRNKETSMTSNEPNYFFGSDFGTRRTTTKSMGLISYRDEYYL